MKRTPHLTTEEQMVYDERVDAMRRKLADSLVTVDVRGEAWMDVLAEAKSLGIDIRKSEALDEALGSAIRTLQNLYFGGLDG